MKACSENLLKMMQGDLRWRLPIYQRPYSWGFAQCEQLWNDILEVGRPVESQRSHYLGSLVQCGTDDVPGEPQAFLLIDGQQRLTSVMLLIAAMADLRRERTEQPWASIPRERLLACLLDGDDPAHDIRLTLTEHDEPEYRRIITSVVDPDASQPASSFANAAPTGRLTRNYGFFRRALADLGDPTVIWRGMNRLEVVSIALGLLQDDPQEVFESLNSTGETLSTFDLVRNYMLMDLPERAQNRLYRDQWMPLEESLRSAESASRASGAGSRRGRGHDREEEHSESFDRFLSAWLTVRMAPEVPSRDSLYEDFRRQVPSGDEQALTATLKEMNQYAASYRLIRTAVSRVQETNARPQSFESQLIRRLAGLESLNYGVALPSMLYFLDLHQRGAIGDEDLLSLLRTLESYLFRRSVCGFASSGLNKFLPQIIGYLKRVRAAQQGSDGPGDESEEQEQLGRLQLRRVFEAALLRDGDSHAMPGDEEFAERLETGDCYHFRDCRYLLFSLENERRPKDLYSIDSDELTIEHILPQKGAGNPEWMAAFGGDGELLGRDINLLGNLTLTQYNSELSDGTFAQKKTRTIGGYDHSPVLLSSRLRQTDVWNDAEIRARGKELAQAALRLWPSPDLTREEAEDVMRPLMTRQRNRRSPRGAFSRLVARGAIPEGGELVGTWGKRTVRAHVEGARIVLDDGESFGTPSSAALTALRRAGSQTTAENGWDFWTYRGRTLGEIRREAFGASGGQTVEESSGESADLSTASRLRRDFWSGLLDYCATRDDFTQMFHWGAGLRGRWERTYLIISGPYAHPFVGYIPTKQEISVRIDIDTEQFLQLTDRRAAITAQLEQKLAELRHPSGQEAMNVSVKIQWEEIFNHRGRIALIRSIDIGQDSRDEAYRWIADSLLMLVKTVMPFDTANQQ